MMMRPASHGHETDDHVERGGLAGAVRSQQADDFAARHLDRQILDHLPRTITLWRALRRAGGSCAALVADLLAVVAVPAQGDLRRCLAPVGRTPGLMMPRTRFGDWPPGLICDALVAHVVDDHVAAELVLAVLNQTCR